MAVDDNVIGRNPCRMKVLEWSRLRSVRWLGSTLSLALAGAVPERYRALILATFGSLRWGSWCPAQPVGGCAARKRAFGRRPGDRSDCGRSQRPQARLRLSLTVPNLSRVRTRSRSSTCTGGLVQNRRLKTSRPLADQAPDVEPGHPGRVGTGLPQGAGLNGAIGHVRDQGEQRAARARGAHTRWPVVSWRHGLAKKSASRWPPRGWWSLLKPVA